MISEKVMGTEMDVEPVILVEELKDLIRCLTLQFWEP